MLKGYKFCKINEMIVHTINNRHNMTYKYYLNQPMPMCERKINMIIAKNPHLINSLDRKKPPFNKKIFSYTILLTDKCS